MRMIEVRNVTRTYGKKGSAFQALRGISFQIPTGATAAIIGKSGSGKSTLMHLMGGLDHPTTGDVLINGKPLASLSRRAIDRFRAHDLGFVFQSFFVEGNQSCYQNVALPLEINNIAPGKRRQLVDTALEQVELFDKARAKASTLSGGQRQRLAIARAIVHRPRIILADEPTGNLDSATGEKIINLLFDLNRRLQCTLVLVTHDEELAARCQYQIIVRDGKLLSMRAPASVASKSRNAPTVMPSKAKPTQQGNRTAVQPAPAVNPKSNVTTATRPNKQTASMPSATAKKPSPSRRIIQ